MTEFEKLILRAVVLIIEGLAIRHDSTLRDGWHRETIRFRAKINSILEE